MKTVDLSAQPMSAKDLLEMARKDELLVRTGKGECFVVSQAEEFAAEVDLLRRNHTFLTMLDRFKHDQAVIPLMEVEKQRR
jgi:hypothetical protein